MSTYTPYATATNPLLGGSLSIGPTGLPPSLASQLPGMGPGFDALPYAAAGRGGLAAAGEGLASQAAGLGSRFALAPGLTPMSALGRVGGYGFLGQVGSGVIDKTNIGGQNSNLEQGLQGAATGAGLGAGVGSIVPGIGTATGAVVGGIAGGAIGVLSNMFGGGGGEDAAREPLDVLATAIDTARLPPDQEAAIIQTFDTQLALADSLEGDAKEAAEAAAFEYASQLILQAMQQNQLQAQQQMGPMGGGQPDLLALQQQAQQVFQPLADDIRGSAALYSQAMGGIRDSLPPEMQGIADMSVAREMTSADRLASAYMAQAALTPVAQRLTQYQQDQNAFASQLFQQQQAQMAAQMAQGGMGMFGQPAAAGTDLLSQLQPTG